MIAYYNIAYVDDAIRDVEILLNLNMLLIFVVT